jgi:hypothetical protein
MKYGRKLSVVALALLSGVSMASANDMSKSRTTGSAPAAQSAAKDSLSLSSEQQKSAWQDISKSATKVKAPAGFTAKVGEVIPSSISAQPVPAAAAHNVPALQPYQYVLLDSNKLLIVNPADHKVAEVISQ